MRRSSLLAFLAVVAGTSVTFLPGCQSTPGRRSVEFVDPFTQKPTRIVTEVLPDGRTSTLPDSYVKCGQYNLKSVDGVPLPNSPSFCVYCKPGDNRAPRYVDMGCDGGFYDPIGPDTGTTPAPKKGGKATGTLVYDQLGRQPSRTDPATFTIDPLSNWTLDRGAQALIVNSLYDRGVTVTVAGLDIGEIGPGAIEMAEPGMQIVISGNLNDVIDASAILGMPEVKVFSEDGRSIRMVPTGGQIPGVAMYYGDTFVGFEVRGVDEEPR